MEIIALQQYTDKYVSLYQGEIRNINTELAQRLIEKGVVAEHIEESGEIPSSDDSGKAIYSYTNWVNIGVSPPTGLMSSSAILKFEDFVTANSGGIPFWVLPNDIEFEEHTILIDYLNQGMSDTTITCRQVYYDTSVTIQELWFGAVHALDSDGFVIMRTNELKAGGGDYSNLREVVGDATHIILYKSGGYAATNNNAVTQKKQLIGLFLKVID